MSEFQSYGISLKIDMKKPGDFTKHSLRELIASKDDTQHRQFRVSDDGYVYLSDDIGNLKLEGVKFCLETMLAGNGYVGDLAAKDNTYIDDLYRVIKKAWEEGSTGMIDHCG